MKQEVREAIRRMPDSDMFIKRLRLYKQYQDKAEKLKNRYKESWTNKEFIQHMNPCGYKAVLKRMEKNAEVLKLERRCMVCGSDDINILGVLVDMCIDDIAVMRANFENVTVVREKGNMEYDWLRRPRWAKCPWCKKRVNKVYTVNIYCCSKCNWRISQKCEQ